MNSIVSTVRTVKSNGIVTLSKGLGNNYVVTTTYGNLFVAKSKVRALAKFTNLTSKAMIQGLT